MPEIQETHDIGRRYWYVQQYTKVPRAERTVRMPLVTETAMAYEVDPPFRTGRGRSFRFWPTRWYLFIGLWSREGAEEAVVALREEQKLDMRDTGTPAEELRDWRGPSLENAPEEDGVTIIHWAQDWPA